MSDKSFSEWLVDRLELNKRIKEREKAALRLRILAMPLENRVLRLLKKVLLITEKIIPKLEDKFFLLSDKVYLFTSGKKLLNSNDILNNSTILEIYTLLQLIHDRTDYLINLFINENTKKRSIVLNGD